MSEIVSQVEVLNKKGEIVGYMDFERVNWDNPQSIMNYMQPLVDEIVRVSENYIPLLNDTEYDIERDERIAKLDIFKTIEENDKKKKEIQKREERSKKNAFFRLANKGISLIKKASDSEDVVQSYAEQFSDFNENVDAIAVDVDNQMQQKIDDIQLTFEFIQQLQPYVDKMNFGIKVGYDDLEDYKNNVVSVLENKERTDEENSELNRARSNVKVFERRLSLLERHVININNTIDQHYIRNANGAETMFLLQEYRTIGISSLRTQASLVISAKRDAEDTQRLKNQIDATNRVIEQTSMVVKDTVENVIELKKFGVIRVDALNNVRKNIEDARALLKKSDQLVEGAASKQRELISKLREASESNLDDLDSIITQAEGFVGKKLIPDDQPKQYVLKPQKKITGPEEK